MKKEFKPTNNHLVIFRFIKTEIPEIKNNKFWWPKELKIAKNLLLKYPIDFLIKLKEPFYPFKMKSLAWFLVEDGKKFLTNEYFEYQKETTNLTNEVKEVKLEKEKIGNDIKIQDKPKSLNEFLNMFK